MVQTGERISQLATEHLPAKVVAAFPDIPLHTTGRGAKQATRAIADLLSSMQESPGNERQPEGVRKLALS